jgi:D-glycero-D-manno-heptose 1,7-bisphosphate phosphatase
VEPLTPERLDGLTMIPGVVETVVRLSGAGFVCPVVTVQSAEGKGRFSSAQFASWFASFAANLNTHGVVRPYVCPHRLTEPSPCKKPNTLLYERAAVDHGLNVVRSFVIVIPPTTSARRDGWEHEAVLSARAGRPSTRRGDRCVRG